MNTIKKLIFGAAVLLLCLTIHATDQQGYPTTAKDLVNGPILILHQSTNLSTSQYNIVPVPQRKDLILCPQFVGGASTNTGTVGLKFTTYYGGIGTNGVGTNSSTTTVNVTATANGTTIVRQPIVLLATTMGPINGIALTTFTNNTFSTDVTGGSLTLSNCIVEFPNN